MKAVKCPECGSAFVMLVDEEGKQMLECGECDAVFSPDDVNDEEFENEEEEKKARRLRLLRNYSRAVRLFKKEKELPRKKDFAFRVHPVTSREDFSLVPNEELRKDAADAWEACDCPPLAITGPKANVFRLYNIEDYCDFVGELVARKWILLSPGGVRIMFGLDRRIIHQRVWNLGTMFAVFYEKTKEDLYWEIVIDKRP